ncbi:alanine--tRNA ligase [Aerococcus kribbianus]|uniref:Alanine--tRNA ligase n=1 Tax=Aerococcus kribbianus TaxID=2999064 RepID=A0A9X3FUY0_9LACT|nr:MULTISPECIES: alanine--tRNA ligase [unclassified Aerococcus]MCZ0716699.1 alanine--tRNA ligase [Aerococcus sp. YH-aer221]MCZ0724987.1 alanine--tRNA ligase [Aerococcus sp. YH-aer222]
MQALTSAEIRQKWLDFWESKGHSVEPSASLVPVDDPTLLWINSGVATLKKYFDGSVVPDNPRITNSQKSIRTNDIENVGVTARHHTLFEMLGNFSIGDYFKAEVIPWAWELLTGPEWFAIDPNKLYMTYYPEDKETLALWQEVTGLSDEHFVPVEDNFWDLGAGPCGPDTEIFFDRGEKFQDLEDSDPEMYPGGENERYLEIWNIVFSQFNHMPDGQYLPLKHKNIDTGMGLERMASVMQDAETNFETDLFMPIIHAIEKRDQAQNYGANKTTDVSYKVIADHIRAVTFAIGDRALPSNEGRGYILRRLIRRAMMHGRRLGINRAFLSELVPVVGHIMEDYYPEILADQDFIMEVIATEEGRFLETISEGEAILSAEIDRLKADKENTLAGDFAFKLYDTYGFPLELTDEYLADANMATDHDAFNQEMQAQRERARAARKDSQGMGIQSEILGDIQVASQFIGYDHIAADSVVNALILDDQFVDEAGPGDLAYLTTEVTPFYAEMGGQVADTGFIQNEAGESLGRVVDVQRAPNGQHLHQVELLADIQINQMIHLLVDEKRRHAITKNHTATHLLHQALKDILGDHANQAGSLVNENELRFDFTHFGQVTDQELVEMEHLVNEKVWEGIQVQTIETSIEEAKARGAMALFGEKYGDQVRMVTVDDWSIELCGGVHVANTAEIGVFKIMSESGIGAGVRRIVAVTGEAAVNVFKAQEEILKSVAEYIKVQKPQEIMPRLQANAQENKALEQELSSLKSKANQAAAGQVFQDVQSKGDRRYIAAALTNKTMDDLRKINDEWKQGDYSDVLVLATDNQGKANLLVAVNDKLIGEGVKAGDLIKELAPIVGGGGGGRPNLAQAGGKNPAGIQDALSKVADLL